MHQAKTTLASLFKATKPRCFVLPPQDLVHVFGRSRHPIRLLCALFSGCFIGFRCAASDNFNYRRWPTRKSCSAVARSNTDPINMAENKKPLISADQRRKSDAFSSLTWSPPCFDCDGPYSVFQLSCVDFGGPTVIEVCKIIVRRSLKIIYSKDWWRDHYAFHYGL